MLIISRRKLLASGAAALAYNKLVAEEARAQSPCGFFYPSASSIPSYATAVGYNQILFEDDFTVANTVGPTGGTVGSANFFLRGNIGATAANAAVSTQATASGAFASPLGGILTLNGPTFPGDGNTTIYSVPPATINVSVPTYGCYTHALWQFYAQLPITKCANNQWSALWFFTQKNSALNGNQVGTEIDAVENYNGNFGFTQQALTTGGHQWQVGQANQIAGGGGTYGTIVNGSFVQTNADTNYHLYEVLWVSTGTGTGYIEIRYDTVLQAIFNNGNPITRIPTGTGGLAGYQWLELNGYPLFMQLGGPPGANLNIDYVRVIGNANSIFTG